MITTAAIPYNQGISEEVERIFSEFNNNLFFFTLILLVGLPQEAHCIQQKLYLLDCQAVYNACSVR